MFSQKALDEQTKEEIEARQRYERLYPPHRPSYIGDILGILEEINSRLVKLEKTVKLKKTRP